MTLYDTAALAARIRVGTTVMYAALIPSASTVLATRIEALSLLPATAVRLLPSLAVAGSAALSSGLATPAAGTGLAVLLLGAHRARTRSLEDGVRDASIKRPEYAPPLLYPESQVSVGQRPLL